MTALILFWSVRLCVTGSRHSLGGICTLPTQQTFNLPGSFSRTPLRQERSLYFSMKATAKLNTRPLIKQLRNRLKGVLLQTGSLQDLFSFWLHTATQGILLLPDQDTACQQDLSPPGSLGPWLVNAQGRWESTAVMLCHPSLLCWVLSVLWPII